MAPSNHETLESMVTFTQADIDAYYNPMRKEGLMFTEIPTPVDFAVMEEDVQKTARDLALLQKEEDIGSTYQVSTENGVTMTYRDETLTGENTGKSVFEYSYQKPDSGESPVQFSVGLKRKPSGGAENCYQFPEGTTLPDAISLIGTVAPVVAEAKEKLHEFVELQEDFLATQFQTLAPIARQRNPELDNQSDLQIAQKNAEAIWWKNFWEKLEIGAKKREGLSTTEGMVAKAYAAVRGLERKQRQEQR